MSSSRLALARAIGLAATPVQAQDMLQPGERYRVDLTATPVLAGGRVLGIAGAVTSLAHGIDGVTFNPAAYAARTPWELSRVEFDLSAGILFGAGLFGGEGFKTNDFWWNGRGDGFGVDNFIFLDLGARLQIDDFGFGVMWNGQFFTDIGSADVYFGSTAFGMGYGFWEGQFVVGVGGRLSGFSLTDPESGDTIVSLRGMAAEAGFEVAPYGRPWRVGAVFRTPTEGISGSENNVGLAGGFVLPEGISLPWEVRAGAALQLGPRPLNPRPPKRIDVTAELVRRRNRQRCQRAFDHGWVDRADPVRDCHTVLPEDPDERAAEVELRRWEDEAFEREAEVLDEEEEMRRRLAILGLPRRFLLISFDMILYGTVADGIGVDAFLAQERRRRGESIGVGARLGLEGEPWRDRMKMRVGGYIEPGRYANVGVRPHLTVGFDLRLFRLWTYNLRVTFSLDVAQDYFEWGFGLGNWH